MLDPSGRKEVFRTVRRLNREAGITVVWITHFMEEAAQADRLLVMSDGAVAMQGTPREVFRQVQAVRALGLDVPPLTALGFSLRGDGLALPDDILTLEEMVEALCPLLHKP